MTQNLKSIKVSWIFLHKYLNTLETSRVNQQIDKISSFLTYRCEYGFHRNFLWSQNKKILYYSKLVFAFFPRQLLARDPARGTWKQQHAPGWRSGRWPSRCGFYCCTELQPGCRRRPPPSCPGRSLCSPLQAGSTIKHIRKCCFRRFLQELSRLKHKSKLHLQHGEIKK